MNAEAWIGLASVAAFVLVQAVVVAFLLGGLFARVSALERMPRDSDCATQLATLTATLQGFKETSERRMDGVDQAIHSVRNQLMIMSTGKAPTRSRAGA